MGVTPVTSDSNPSEGLTWEVSATDGELGGARFEVTNRLVGTPPNSTLTGRAFELTENVDVGDEAATKRIASRVPVTTSEGWLTRFTSSTRSSKTARGFEVDFERAGEWNKAVFTIRSGLEEGATCGFVERNVTGDPDVNWRCESAGRDAAIRSRVSGTDTSGFGSIDRAVG